MDRSEPIFQTQGRKFDQRQAASAFADASVLCGRAGVEDEQAGDRRGPSARGARAPELDSAGSERDPDGGATAREAQDADQRGNE